MITATYDVPYLITGFWKLDRSFKLSKWIALDKVYDYEYERYFDKRFEKI